MMKYVRYISILTVMLFSLFLIQPIDVYAYTASTGQFTGKEDPHNADDFDGSIVAMNMYKAWSVFKGSGMSDEQAIAALACMQAESGFKSHMVEGKFGITGYSMDSFLGYTKYVDTYSKYIDTDADKRTQFTDEVLRYGYGIAQTTIDKCRAGQASQLSADERKSQTSGKLFALSMYYDEHGVGWLGGGLYQFTGKGNLSKLFDWCSSIASRWYEFEAQLAYFYAETSIGGYRGETLKAWIDATKDNHDLNELVETYFHSLINAGGWSNLVPERQQIAIGLEPRFRGLAWNEKYAKEVLSLAGWECASTATGIQDRSLVKTYVGKEVYYPINGGMLINIDENAKIVERNIELHNAYLDSVKNDTSVVTSKKYSLFELYGEDLHWYRYFGENTIMPNLFDHVWSAVDQNKAGALVSIDTILYDPNTYLSCNVYPDRPEVLTERDINNHLKDPRVRNNVLGILNGYNYVTGSFELEVAKFTTAIISFLIGPELRETVTDVYDRVTGSELWPTIKNLLFVVLSFAMVLFIFSMVKHGIQYAKARESARESIGRFVIGVIALGMAFVGLARPYVFNSILNKSVNVIDSLFNDALTETLANDEVICVTDPDLAIHAALWRKTVFNPWCRGQFEGREYEQLYTHYTSRPEEEMLPQDNDEIDPLDATGKAFYNSVQLTGDISVPVGLNTEIKNWAAYLYSCGTLYHIDSEITKEQLEEWDGKIETFPSTFTKTTANDSTICADFFRIIDAQMNISPQYYANGGVINNYVQAHNLKPQFFKQGKIALFNTLLLLVLVPMIFKKIVSFVGIITTVIQMIWYSIMELWKENGGFKPFGEAVKKNFIDYFVACLKLNLLVTVYYMFVDKGFLELVLYLVLSFVIYSVNWNDIRNTSYRIKQNVKTIRRNI